MTRRQIFLFRLLLFGLARLSGGQRSVVRGHLLSLLGWVAGVVLFFQECVGFFEYPGGG
jgi:hypothetical protein